MKQSLTCIICPRGCTLTVEQNGEKISVTGNSCPKGEKYGIEECTHPTRTVTSIVRISNRLNCMVSVKTATPIAKERIFEAMAQIRSLSVPAPVKIGDVLAENICGAKIIATKTVK